MTDLVTPTDKALLRLVSVASAFRAQFNPHDLPEGAFRLWESLGNEIDRAGAPVAIEPVAVKALEWDDDGDWQGNECAANSLAGLYMILASKDVPGKLRLILNYHADGEMYQITLIDGASDTQARDFAETDYANRIRSALAQP